MESNISHGGFCVFELILEADVARLVSGWPFTWSGCKVLRVLSRQGSRCTVGADHSASRPDLAPITA